MQLEQSDDSKNSRDSDQAEGAKTKKAAAKASQETADTTSPEGNLLDSLPKPNYPRYRVDPKEAIALSDFVQIRAKTIKKRKILRKNYRISAIA